MCHLSRDTRRRVYGINLTQESREKVIILMERELSKSGVSISVKRKPSLSRRVISHVALNVTTENIMSVNCLSLLYPLYLAQHESSTSHSRHPGPSPVRRKKKRRGGERKRVTTRDASVRRLTIDGPR